MLKRLPNSTKRNLLHDLDRNGTSNPKFSLTAPAPTRRGSAPPGASNTIYEDPVVEPEKKVGREGGGGGWRKRRLGRGGGGGVLVIVYGPSVRS